MNERNLIRICNLIRLRKSLIRLRKRRHLLHFMEKGNASSYIDFILREHSPFFKEGEGLLANQGEVASLKTEIKKPILVCSLIRLRNRRHLLHEMEKGSASSYVDFILGEHSPFFKEGEGLLANQGEVASLKTEIKNPF